MAITFDTKYPAALKNAAWQKNKSFKDKTKSKTKTGLGQALNAAEAAWKLIKFNNLIAAKQGITATSKLPLQELTAIRSRASDYLNNDAQPVQKAIEALDKAATKARTTARNTYLSATAQKAATALSGQLTRQAKLLRDIKLTDFNSVVSKLNTSLSKLEGQHTETLHAMDDVVDRLRTDQDTQAWDRAERYLQQGLQISQSLMEQSGDKGWTDINNLWRRVVVAYAEADRKLKTLPSEFAFETMKEFADLFQRTMGGVFM